jgi:hypothetical protein
MSLIAHASMRAWATGHLKVSNIAWVCPATPLRGSVSGFPKQRRCCRSFFSRCRLIDLYCATRVSRLDTSFSDRCSGGNDLMAITSHSLTGACKTVRGRGHSRKCSANQKENAWGEPTLWPNVFAYSAIRAGESVRTLERDPCLASSSSQSCAGLRVRLATR